MFSSHSAIILLVMQRIYSQGENEHPCIAKCVINFVIVQHN